TGLWTRRLVEHATELTAIDAAPEALALNRERVASERVRYLQADLFQWQPRGLFDFVFFGFWLSHVPPHRFASFWETVRAAGAPRAPPGRHVLFLPQAPQPGHRGARPPAPRGRRPRDGPHPERRPPLPRGEGVPRAGDARAPAVRARLRLQRPEHGRVLRVR